MRNQLKGVSGCSGEKKAYNMRETARFLRLTGGTGPYGKEHSKNGLDFLLIT
ncbi:MAG: hypothetical protein ABUJ92_14055 [Desulfobacterales bacterium]